MRKTILIIDDSSIVRDLIRGGLEEVGYGTIEAFDGLHAIKRMAGKKIDLIILDLYMPVMDGFAFMELLNMRPERPPVIVISSTHEEGLNEKLRDLKIRAFANKPFVIEKLVKAVRKILEE